jgi:CDGSH-type Zn-finger protein
MDMAQMQPQADSSNEQEQETAEAVGGAPDPWNYSSKDGILVLNGRIRVYGFRAPLEEPLGTPRLARRTPARLKLKPGNYSWCTCGHAKTQPFCDNSHREIEEGPPWRSYKFEVLEESKVSLCRCKQTNNPPFCDCRHEDVP